MAIMENIENKLLRLIMLYLRAKKIVHILENEYISLQGKVV